MPELRFDDISSVGFNDQVIDGTSIGPVRRHAKADQAIGWEVSNVMFGPGYLENTKDPLGLEDITADIVSIKPNYIFPVQSPTKNYIVAFDLTSCHVFQHNDDDTITRASGAYTGTATDRWVGTFLNGIAAFTNNVDLPQSWSSIDETVLLTDLPNWPASTTCKTIASYKNFLVTGNVTKSGTNYPTLIKWSDVAQPGSVPTSWDETDATVFAGEYPLSGTDGEVLDIVPLRDSLIIYKEDAIVRMQWVGGVDVFRFDTLSEEHGLYAQGCAVEYLPGWHVMIAASGKIIRHNGQTFEILGENRMESIFEEKWRTQVAASSPGAVAADHSQKKVYFGYGNTTAWMVAMMVWDWEGDTWTLYNPNYSSRFYDIQEGFRIDDSGNLLPGFSVWLGHIAAGQEDIYQLNHVDGTPENLPVFQTEVLSFGGIDRFGNKVPDPEGVKVLKHVRPFFSWTGSTAPTFTVNIWTQERWGGAVTKTGTIAFTGGANDVVEFLTEAVYYQLEFIGTNAVPWKMHGFTLEVERMGENL